jgi:hypothetical protein
LTRDPMRKLLFAVIALALAASAAAYTIQR